MYARRVLRCSAPRPSRLLRGVVPTPAPAPALPSASVRTATVTFRRGYSSSSSSSSSSSPSPSPGEEIPTTVPLVYDLHEPAKPLMDRRTSPILFLHGLFGSKNNNRSISKAIARDLGRYIYALDLRNHGESPHVQRHDYPSMAADVAAFIEQHELKNPTIIGHSMGAKTAMTLALYSPEMVRDIVAVDNAPVDAILGMDFSKYVRAMKRIEEANVTRQSDADKILKEVEPSLAVRQFLLQNLYQPEGGHVKKFRVPLGVLGRCLPNLGDFPYKDPARARFAGPALFVRGSQSTYVPDEVLPVIGAFFPRFELVDIDAGHWLISEQPEAFRQAVVRFLGPRE